MSGFSLFLSIAVLLTLLALLGIVGHFLLLGALSVPWVRTSRRISRRMLEIAAFTTEDHVLDLGSGDGAIVFEAVRMGGTGEGIEQARLLVWYARVRAFIKGVSSKAVFHRADIFMNAFPPASIVTCYLFSEVNAKLEPRLKEAFPKGTKVVSRDFPFPSLSLLKTESCGSSTIYLYEI